MNQIITFVFAVLECCWHRSSQIDYLVDLAAGLFSVTLDTVASPSERSKGIQCK